MISKRLRHEVMRRDGYTCRYCGQEPPDVKLTIDHVVPTALGGSDKPDNLVTACADCNAGKSSTSPNEPVVDGVSDSTLRWAAAMQQAAAIQAAKRDEVAEYIDAFDAHWPEGYERPNDWRRSIERFHTLGLELEILVGAIDKAKSKDRLCFDQYFRYVCGVGWGVLNERQEIARDLFEEAA